MRYASLVASSRSHAVFGRKQSSWLGVQAKAIVVRPRFASSTPPGGQAVKPVVFETPESHQVYENAIRNHHAIGDGEGEGEGDGDGDGEARIRTSRLRRIDSWCGEKLGTLRNARAPADSRVSCSDQYDVLGSFTTTLDQSRESTAERKTAVYIPGAPPIWKSPPLPYEMPKKSTRARKKRPLRFRSGDKTDKYLWKVPITAIQTCSPETDLSSIDVIITARRLESFWAYAAGATAMDLAANVTLIHNTLFVDGFEPVGLEMEADVDWSDPYASCGNAWPLPLPNSLRHYQIVQYTLEGLKIAVVAGVDTTVEGKDQKGESLPYQASTVIQFDSTFPAYDSVWKWRGMYHTWLRRQPSTVMARREGGWIREQSIRSTKGLWRYWRLLNNNQMTLHGLAALFNQLRDVLRQQAPDQPCIVKSARPENSKRKIGRDEAELKEEQVGPIKWLLKERATSRDPRKRMLLPLEIWRAEHGRYPLPKEEAEEFAVSWRRWLSGIPLVWRYIGLASALALAVAFAFSRQRATKKRDNDSVTRTSGIIPVDRK